MNGKSAILEFAKNLSLHQSSIIFVYTQITHLVISCLSFVYLQHCQPDAPVHGKGNCTAFLSGMAKDMFT